MVDLDRIHPVTDFVRNYKSYLTRLKQTRRPEVLTVNGVAECVLVDAKTFQEMQESAEVARFVRAVNEGIESMASGESVASEEAFKEMRSRLGLPSGPR